jgi:hypothetical protein
MLVRPFTPAEDRLMTALRIEGLGTTAIAKFLLANFGHPRSAATVNMRLKRLAEIEEMAEAAAE